MCAEDKAYERKKTNNWLGQNVCNLIPCSLLRDLLEHLQTPPWRGWEWDVAPSKSTSSLWPLLRDSGVVSGKNGTGTKEGALMMTDVPVPLCSVTMVTILRQGLKHKVTALLWSSREQVLLFDELGLRSSLFGDRAMKNTLLTDLFDWNV